MISICSKSKEELGPDLKGAWCKIAESLPRRSVQSCHNFCRRKFNPNNYNGKWTKEEEAFLTELVHEQGHSWKEITRVLNNRFESENHLKFGRTAENVKDKWKQMGGENVNTRERGPWGLEEGLELLKFIELATAKKLQKSDVIVHLKYLKEGYFNASGKRLKVKEDEDGNKHIFVYDRSVTLEEIVPQTIKKQSCEKIIPTLTISWTAIHNSMKRRSVDDIRNYWQVKLLPLLVPS